MLAGVANLLCIYIWIVYRVVSRESHDKLRHIFSICYSLTPCTLIFFISIRCRNKFFLYVHIALYNQYSYSNGNILSFFYSVRASHSGSITFRTTWKLPSTIKLNTQYFLPDFDSSKSLRLIFINKWAVICRI